MATADFDLIWANASSVLDTTFAEKVKITPMKSGQYLSATDGGRQSMVVRGIYDSKTVDVRDLGHQTAIRSQTDRVDDRVTIDFFGDDLGPLEMWPRIGDKMTLVDRPEVPTFEVVSPGASGHGRISFKCVRSAAP